MKNSHAATIRIARRWVLAQHTEIDSWLGNVFDGQFLDRTRVAGKMDFQAVFMMGPPGAGKSWVKAKRYLKHTGFKNLDSDEMKKLHPDYDPMKPSKVHQWSLKEQVNQFYKTLPTGDPFVYDGTGWNPKPVMERIKAAKAAGYRIFLVYVYVPVDVSLFRNRGRGRFVPEDVIIQKAKQIHKSFDILRQIADKSKVIMNFDDRQHAEAKADMLVYPPPQPKPPPRPGDEDYGR